MYANDRVCLHSPARHGRDQPPAGRVGRALSMPPGRILPPNFLAGLPAEAPAGSEGGGRSPAAVHDVQEL